MEHGIARALNQLGAGVIDPVTEAVSALPVLGVLWAVCAAVAIWATERGRRRLALRILLAGILFVACNELLLKHGLGLFRPRPWVADPTIVPIGHPFTDSSFPSSHAASTAAAVTVLGHAFRWFIGVGAALVVFMAFARVHNGMHYPSDVLVGSILGCAYGAVAIAAVRPRSRPDSALPSAPRPHPGA